MALVSQTIALAQALAIDLDCPGDVPLARRAPSWPALNLSLARAQYHLAQARQHMLGMAERTMRLASDCGVKPEDL